MQYTLHSPKGKALPRRALHPSCAPAYLLHSLISPAHDRMHHIVDTHTSGIMCKLIRRDNESYLWHAGAGIRNQTSELGQGEWVG